MTLSGAMPETKRENELGFVAVFEAEFDYVCMSLRRLGARGPDIEDVAHDVFLVLIEKLATLERSASLRPWLFGVAVRSLHAHRRKTRVTTEVPTLSADVADSAPSPSELALATERRRLADSALDELPDEQRAVFILHAIDDVPMPDVAIHLQIPLNTAYSRYRLAKEMFTKTVRRARWGELP